MQCVCKMNTLKDVGLTFKIIAIFRTPKLN